MIALRNAPLLLLAAFALVTVPHPRAAAGYQFVEGYNVLDTNNNPGFTGTAGGSNYAAMRGRSAT